MTGGELERAASSEQVGHPAVLVDRGASTVARRRRLLVVVLLVCVVCAGGGWWAGSRVKSPAQAAADASAPAPSVITAPVERRTIQEAIVARGTVAPAQTVEITLRAPSGTDGTPVVTVVHVAVGDSVEPGAVLLEVSGRPVFVIPGDIPVYRDLKPGMKGDDVRQLQEALAVLGHQLEADGDYGDATKRAVRDLYQAMGFDPVPAGPDDDARLTAAQDQVTAAQRAVEDATDALSQAQQAAAQAAAQTPADGQAAAPGDQSGAAATIASLTRGLDRAKQDLGKTKDNLATVQAEVGPMVPASEIVALPTFPAQVRQVEARVGGPIPDVAVSLSTGDPQVTVAMRPEMTGLVREGQQVQIASEVLNQEASGTLTRIEAVPVAGSGSTDGAAAAPGGTAGGQQLVITPSAPLPAEWNGQDVRVTVVAAASDGAVLVVPLSAVSAGADEQTRVTVQDPGGATRPVDVTTGVVGAGYVQITAAGGQSLNEGDKVVVGVSGGVSAGEATGGSS